MFGKKRKQCETCQYLRLQKVEAPNMPEPPWCSNSKSPFYWKSVKKDDKCDFWEKFVRRAKGVKQRYG